MITIAEWAECVRRHPRCFCFKGLNGKGTDPRDVAVRDVRYMQKLWEKEAEYLYDDLVKGINGEQCDADLDHYLVHLAYQLRVPRTDEELFRRIKNRTDDTAELRALVLDLEKQVGDHRSEFCQPDCDFLNDNVLNDELESFLKEHPPVAAYDHAAEDFVELEDVVFYCPSCGNQPITLECIDDKYWGEYYCGLCGASSCLDRDRTMIDFLDSLDIARRTVDGRRIGHSGLFPYAPERRKTFMELVFQPYMLKERSLPDLIADWRKTL